MFVINLYCNIKKAMFFLMKEKNKINVCDQQIVKKLSKMTKYNFTNIFFILPLRTVFQDFINLKYFFINKNY